MQQLNLTFPATPERGPLSCDFVTRQVTLLAVYKILPEISDDQLANLNRQISRERLTRSTIIRNQTHPT